MAAARVDDLDNMFDDHPSLSASLEDFEENQNRSPLFGLPSQHSGFKSEESEADAESSAGDPWSPPGFRKSNTGGTGWYRHQPYNHDRLDLRPSISASRSRETSPKYEDALEGDLEGDITLPANIPLPNGTDSPVKRRSPSPDPSPERGDGFERPFENVDQAAMMSNSPNNFIRFALRAEVQHREPFVAFFNYLRFKIDSITKSRSSTTLAILMALLSITVLRILFTPTAPPPAPDLVKLSSLAKSFEPLIFYSENGVQQISALQETGVAVWDLGESVRSTNMTSAPLIVSSLDDLSESLKTLALELTKFFANVDADVDSILIVMDWARRELAGLSSLPLNSLTSLLFDNLHNLLQRVGVMESSTGSGLPTPLGKLITEIFGVSTPQRTRATLTRTFTEFLNVLEESINSELTHSTALFALFESIDRQFLNLQRTVVRESDAQERAEGELLSSLWTRVLGPNAALLRKYEKNKLLLASVRSRTVANKHLIMDHRGKLLTLKVNLETLRRKLVSPLVRRNDSVSVDGDGAGVVEAQIRGLEGTYEYLKRVRENQKSKLMEMIYGAGQRRSAIVGGGGAMDGIAIEGR